VYGTGHSQCAKLGKEDAGEYRNGVLQAVRGIGTPEHVPRYDERRTESQERAGSKEVDAIGEDAIASPDARSRDGKGRQEKA